MKWFFIITVILVMIVFVGCLGEKNGEKMVSIMEYIKPTTTPFDGEINKRKTYCEAHRKGWEDAILGISVKDLDSNNPKTLHSKLSVVPAERPIEYKQGFEDGQFEIIKVLNKLLEEHKKGKPVKDIILRHQNKLNKSRIQF